MGIITVSAENSESRFTRAAFWRGFLEALPFILSNGMAGIVMGVAYRSIGLGFIPSALFSIVVYSGTAQAVTLGMWAPVPPVIPMVLACIATNARYLLIGAHLHQLFGKLRKRTMLPVLFLLADASWLMTTADAKRHGPDAGYLFGASVPMAIGWMGGTALGYGMPVSMEGPLAVAAALLPAIFVASLLPIQWHGRRSILPWVLSAAVAVLVSWLVAPSWAMLVGGAIGTVASMARGDDV